MNAQFKKMTGTIADLKNNLAGLDGKRASFADEHSKALTARDRIEKELIRLNMYGSPIDAKETETQLRETESSIKRLALTMDGFRAEQNRLQSELEGEQKRLGEFLTGEAGGWVKVALRDYQKSVLNLQNSVRRLTSANQVLSSYGAQVGKLYSALGPKWPGIFTPVVIDVADGSAKILNCHSDAATVAAVRKELLG